MYEVNEHTAGLLVIAEDLTKAITAGDVEGLIILKAKKDGFEFSLHLGEQQSLFEWVGGIEYVKDYIKQSED